MSDDIPRDEEPLCTLREANESSLEKFDQRMADLIEFAATQYYSSEVRDECVRELEADAPVTGDVVAGDVVAGDVVVGDDDGVAVVPWWFPPIRKMPRPAS